MNHRKSDPTTLDAIIAANKTLMAESWAREFANPDSYWHQLATGQNKEGAQCNR